MAPRRRGGAAHTRLGMGAAQQRGHDEISRCSRPPVAIGYQRSRSGEGAKVGNPKIALVAYGLAIGFILVVAFHSPSKTLITASVPTLMPVADMK